MENTPEILIREITHNSDYFCCFLSDFGGAVVIYSDFK